MADDSTEIVLQLTNAEALVLFELVSRFSKTVANNYLRGKKTQSISRHDEPASHCES